jgi:hypothetical protein
VDRLLEELTGQGLLGVAEAAWASAYAVDQQIAIEGALLELDLVDEESLLRALGSSTGGSPASPKDLSAIDADSAALLPHGLAKSFSMCPLSRNGKRVVAIVERPLENEWIQELRDVFRLEIDQRVAPAHYLLLARERVYGIEAGPRAHALEAKLARRRGIEGIADVLRRWQGPVSLSAALHDVLSFATARVEYACFFAQHGEMLRVLAGEGGGHGRNQVIALPERESSLWPALAHRGCFLGLLPRTGADERFYATLNRQAPRWACVIPAPVQSTSSLSLHCDNGARGFPTRWSAELAILVSRIGQRGISRSEPLPDKQAGPPAVLAEPPVPTQPAVPELTDVERRVLDRLRRAADAASMSLEAFVDLKLGAATVKPPELVETSLLASELKGFFERLATEIPTQLARGMEAAFRDMSPRAAAAAPAAPPAMTPSADVELVVREATPREVSSYQSKRRKTERVKL